MSDVDRIHEELSRLLELAASSGNASDITAAEAIASKALLLSAASHFERAVCELILAVAKESGAHAIFVAFINKQALERKYHTMFSWDASNLNRLFSLFGEDAKKAMATDAKGQDLSAAIADFIYINAQRNLLVHENFAGFSLGATFAEIRAKYVSALRFVAWLDKNLRSLANVKPSATG